MWGHHCRSQDASFLATFGLRSRPWCTRYALRRVKIQSGFARSSESATSPDKLIE